MTLREAAQQALEALETCGEDEWYTHDDYGMVQTYDEEKVHEAITALRAALAEVLPNDMTEGELAAYRAGWQKRSLIEPQRKPLTDEQVRDLWSWSMTAEAERTATTQQHAFARAIEKAHGITGGSDE